ncbi:TagK domain-containing protein [Burkholderia pyrrocinia]|uniref:TagK domain-containing protein n=1 Tax=Burkholderia pyrrocinia TaxID=60550 RepID=UPI00158BF1F2|nr:TagK domain-containing protein [Burkholderia pyrrocinia]
MKALVNLYERVRTRLSRPADAARRRTQIGLSANAESEARLARSLCVSAEGPAAILTVLGTREATSEVGASGLSTRQTQDDLVSEFEWRYWAALEGGTVAAASSEPSHVDPIDPAPLGPIDAPITAGPIFADVNSVEEAFGALSGSAGGDPSEAPAIPEILHVFMPLGPECVARPLAMPALAQREHHLLGVDSPLVFPITQSIGEAS